MREIRPPSGNGLHLVEGASGVAQATPRQLWDGSTARGHQGSQRQGNFVAHAASGVLVDSGAGQPSEGHPLARLDHGRRPG